MATVLTIDERQLDREWLEQPKLFREWGYKYAEAKADAAKRKAQLELVEAEILLDIRKNPTAYELVRPNKEVVEATVITQDRYQEALMTFIKAKHREDALHVMVDALSQRKDALEAMVRLHGMSYFATPRAGGEDAETIGQIKKVAVRKPLGKGK